MFSPQEVAQNYIQTGKKKAGLSVAKALLLSFMAGAFIALAAVGANTVSCTVSNASIAKLVAACVFPAGLAMVLIAGSELFTGNTLLLIPLLNKDIRAKQMLRNWICVYAGNLLGALFVAGLASAGNQWGLFGGQLAVTTIKVALTKVTLGFGPAFMLGLACNFLVCIAVWMSFSATTTSGKIIGLFFPIMLFVLCGFEHSIANMYYIPAGIFAAGNPAFAALAAESGLNTAALSWSSFFLDNLLPVTLGNIVAGALISVVYWFCYLHKEKNNHDL